MKLMKLYCPSCGANVNYDVDSGKKSFFCLHCGSQILVDDEVIRTEHKEIYVDEAAIKKAYYDNAVKQKKLELKEKEIQRKTKIFKLKIIISLCLALATIVSIVLLCIGIKTISIELMLVGVILASLFGFPILFIWYKNEISNNKSEEDEELDSEDDEGLNSGDWGVF